jgi:hypothetical protein
LALRRVLLSINQRLKGIQHRKSVNNILQEANLVIALGPMVPAVVFFLALSEALSLVQHTALEALQQIA